MVVVTIPSDGFSASGGSSGCTPTLPEGNSTCPYFERLLKSEGP